MTKFALIMYLETLFKKNISKITKDELNSVKTLSIDFNDSKEKDFLEFNEIITILPNLNKITIVNKKLTKEDIDNLSTINIEYLKLEKCSIRGPLSLEPLTQMKEISLVNCIVLDFKFLCTMNENIKSISIINPIDEKLIDITYLSKYKELTSLYLEKCTLNNVNYISNFPYLETISLLWSNPYNQLDSSIFTNFHNLKELYISCSEQDKEKLQKALPNVSVYNNLNHLVIEENY